MTTGIAPENCIEVVRPFVAELDAKGLLPDVQLMGGIGSAALKHSGTIIIPGEKRLVTTGNFTRESKDLGLHRDNGTLRDVDILVLSDDPERIGKVKKVAEDTIGEQLEISIFNLLGGARLREQIRDPFGLKVMKTFVSDRYVREDGSGIDKALFPFAMPIDPEVLERWDLEIGGDVFPVVNPASAILNYLTRSITGLRGKDAVKVQEMAALVFAKAPELVDWVIDGPGQSHMEMAGIFQTLRRANSWPQSSRTLVVGNALEIRAGSVRALRHHEAFMLPDADRNTQDAALMTAILKSRGVGIPESNASVVKLYQMFLEKPLDTITKNK